MNLNFCSSPALFLDWCKSPVDLEPAAASEFLLTCFDQPHLGNTNTLKCWTKSSSCSRSAGPGQARASKVEREYQLKPRDKKQKERPSFTVVRPLCVPGELLGCFVVRLKVPMVPLGRSSLPGGSSSEVRCELLLHSLRHY